jgi:uncharacterized protein (DUF2384 family)
MKSLIYEKPISSSLTIASEPEVLYVTSSKLREFTISKFEALGKKLLFSQSEWADILHISDRTLQLYIKDNKSFEGLHAEHLQQLDKMSNLALEIFSKPEKVKSWLMSSKQVLQHSLNFASLQSFWGVKLISNELGRIAYGVYI